jgi:DNA (cytosine-5)-methyltransferase 3A
MNVLSLFNGMNTGRQALENVGIKVEKYYSSEIKPYAIELTQYHFPDTIQVGDVTKWREWDIDWQSIDLILSGSPCQDLSAAGKRAGINGSKSSLFFVFVEILKHIKSLNPKLLFLQENVGSASTLDVGIMSRALGIYPCRINSSLVTAQMRDRYKHTCLNTGSGKGGSQKYLHHRNETTGMLTLIRENEIVRTVNKIEMCRLQGFPDEYCDILTTAKAGSLLGDGWTLPIIEHIFSFINK